MIKKKNKRKIKLRHFMMLFLIIYISIIVINQNKLKKDLRAKEKEVEQDITVLQEDIEELNKQIEKRGSIEFLENVAREELGMVKPNEVIYIDRGRFKNTVFNFFNKPRD
ncbi:FtsB family cell division protein [Tissierella creatinophila]|uniref:Cell division protein FtsL n=1 Tax=Tissierella creatinophila DSM 6911 TaxID=1123403 RepID=A0A1U7M6U5_TISCR|nr:septum formation initiator family protein [Tissierella creatinophila]OLS03005.1 cell division protein FtsL [Tissierella creatinophila DSM 6911]